MCACVCVCMCVCDVVRVCVCSVFVCVFWLIKPIANYDASVILVMYGLKSYCIYLACRLFKCMLEFYIHSLAAVAFLFGLTVISHL